MSVAPASQRPDSKWARLIVGLALCAGFVATPAAAAPNFVVIYMDDQRMNTTWAMPNVTQLATQGVTFQRAYITTPICTPSRNSFLSGGFSPKSVGVLDNSQANGWGNSVGSNIQQLGVALQRAGYRTAMIGKGAAYNGARVTPGWDTLRELNTDAYYTNVTVAAGSSGPDVAGKATIIKGIPYAPDYFRDEALKFLDAVPQSQPFFMFYAPPAMHSEATPNPSGIDANRFLTYAYRGRGYGETDLSDKPKWVTDPASNKVVKVPETDAFHQDQLRTLRDTDRTVGEILAKLTQKGLDQNTVVIFTSDNGYMWGEHGIYQKANAFEESVNVPMIIRAPGTTARNETRIVAVNLDVPATILAQAGATIDGGRTSEGMNLTPLINNTPTTWRTELFLEGYGGFGDGSYGSWGAIISGPWKYITHRSGAEELYNRSTDPFELENRAQDPTVAVRKSQLAAKVNAQKGLIVRKPMWSQPVGRVGQAYSFNPQVWGGTAPYSYSVRSGNLPLGLQLNPATGDISGVPTLTGAATFELQVTDSSLSPFSGKPQRWIEKYTITVR